MEKYAMYLRKSRADQDKTLEDTLRRHKETLIAYAISHDLSVQDVYEEVVSGESLYARPQMLKLLEAVSRRAYAGILCMDIDRLGRGGMSDQGVIIETLKQNDTLIVTPQRTYDLNDETDESNVEFSAFFARYEYKQITKRMKAGTRKSVQEGCYLACAPYGYRNTKINKQSTLEIYEPEAKYVRMMFDLYNSGYGCQTIADRLNAMGVSPHRTDKWGRTSVMSILKNYAYNGKVVWDKITHIKKGTRGNAKHIRIYNPPEKWTITEGLHDAIISDEQWETTQGIIKDRTHPPSFTGDIKNALSGLVYCGNCGSLMSRTPERHRNGKTESARYLCLKRSCIAGTKYELLEKAVINSLREKLKKYDSLKQINRTQENNFEEQLKSISGSISVIKKQQSKLHELLECEIYSVETFLDRQQALQLQLDTLNSEYAAVKKQADSVKIVDIEQTKQNISDVLSCYWQADISTRNHLLKTVIEKVVYFKDKKTKPADFTLEIKLNQAFL